MPDIGLLKEYLVKWRDKYGEEQVSRKYECVYKVVPIKQREQLLIYFFRWMRMHGFEKEHFSNSSFENLFINICFGGPPPETEREKKSRKKGHEAVQEQLFLVLTCRKPFGKPSSGKQRDHNPKNIEKIKQKEKEKQALKTEQDRKEYDMYKDTIDPSTLKDLPKTNVVWDDDLEKELGGK